MKYLSLVFFTFIFIITTPGIYAQETGTNAAHEASVKEAKKEADSYNKKIKEEKSRLKKEQKQFDKHQKDLKKAEKNVEKTEKKISKIEAKNEKLNQKLNSLSEEEVQRLKVKIKENELDIQILKVKQIDQQKKVDQIKAGL